VENVSGETAWINGKLVFTDATVADVLSTLRRWYGYEFHVADPSMTQQIITVGVSTQSSAQAIAMMEQILNVSLHVSGDTVTLTPRRPRAGAKGARYSPYDVWTPSREVGR